MYKELQALYGSLPPMRVHVFDPATFRENKPDARRLSMDVYELRNGI